MCNREAFGLPVFCSGSLLWRDKLNYTIFFKAYVAVEEMTSSHFIMKENTKCVFIHTFSNFLWFWRSLKLLYLYSNHIPQNSWKYNAYSSSCWAAIIQITATMYNEIKKEMSLQRCHFMPNITSHFLFFWVWCVMCWLQSERKKP